jgi:DNA processing protein
LKYHFPERNRIISGLARAVVLGQCPEKSGALITADFALEQGRELLVFREGLEGANGRGGMNLVDEGASVIANAESVLRQWGKAAIVRVFSDMGASADSTGSGMAEMLEMELAGKLISNGEESLKVGEDFK